MIEEANDVIELIDEDGKRFQFRLIEAIEVDDKKYAILLPLDLESDEALVLKVKSDENGEEFLTEIEDDQEWELVAQAWEKLNEEE